jgi:phosphatidylinositol alpha-mannosyltransferase
VLAPSAQGAHDRNGYHFVPASDSISVPTNGSRAPIAPTPRAFAAVRRALRDFDPTVLHLHEPLVPGPSLFALWNYRGPIVGTFHRARPGWVYPVYGRLNALGVRKIAIKVAVSSAAAATASTALGRAFGQPVIVPNGIDRSRISACPRPPAGPCQRVVFLGRHEVRKGLAILLEAFSGIGGEVELNVIGEGPETERLRQRFTDDRIIWSGSVSDDEKVRALAGADVFVAPSLGGESFGVVLLEAMAGGAAVIASDLPGYREAGADAASYVPPGDPVALRSRIAALLAADAERHGLAAAGVARSAQFDFAAVAEAYVEIYDRAHHEHAARSNGSRSVRRLHS